MPVPAETLARISDMGVLPVVQLPKLSGADALADALVAGGLPCLEITFRTAGAPTAVERLARRGDLLVGAGTVLDAVQARMAVEAGAAFVVSPGCSPEVMDYCRERGVLAVPGVCTPTEIMRALSAQADALKFFPAEAMGGLGTLKALAAPFGAIKFIPTGGIKPGMLAEYLACPAVAAVGGSWMVSAELLQHERWTEITRLASDAVAIVRSIRPTKLPS